MVSTFSYGCDLIDTRRNLFSKYDFLWESNIVFTNLIISILCGILGNHSTMILFRRYKDIDIAMFMQES